MGDDEVKPGNALTSRAYAIGMVLLVGVLLVGAVVVNANYTRTVSDRADRRQTELRIQSEKRANDLRVQSDQRWCALFALLDPKGAPPTTERSRLVQAAVIELRKGFHCEGA
ncbi:MAG: hypothetical protein ABIS86_17080 [Streptosporangiaceae bacterium]